MERPEWFRWRSGYSAVLGFVILGIGVIAGFQIQNNDRHTGKVQTCESVLFDRKQLAKTLGNSQSSAVTTIDPSLSPEIQDLLRKAQEQNRKFLETSQQDFLVPLPICEEVQIESRIVLKDANGVVLVPALVPSTLTSSTTTTQPTTSSQSVQGVPGPPGPQGPPGPAGSSSPSAGSSSETSTTTTSTTQPAPTPTEPLVIVCVANHCIR